MVDGHVGLVHIPQLAAGEALGGLGPARRAPGVVEHDGAHFDPNLWVTVD